jgi:hypothetical protein
MGGGAVVNVTVMVLDVGGETLWTTWTLDMFKVTDTDARA